MKLPPYMKLALGFPGSPQRGVPHRASRMGDLDVRCLQRLRDAEESAAAFIAAARARKTTRLKQVKAEAEVEIAAYRQQRETTFQLFAEECTGVSSTHQRSVARCTEEELASVALKVSANKQAMIDSLLQSVTTYVGNKAAQTSASWLSGGPFQGQIMPQGCPELRPASANQPLGPRWPAISALFST